MTATAPRSALVSTRALVSGVLLLTGASAAALLVRYGSLDAAARRFAGDLLYCRAPVARVHVQPERPASVEFELRNLSPRELVLYGATASCGCIAGESFPVRIPALSVHPLRFRVVGAKQPGVGHFTIRVFATADVNELELQLAVQTDPTSSESLSASSFGGT